MCSCRCTPGFPTSAWRCSCRTSSPRSGTTSSATTTCCRACCRGSRPSVAAPAVPEGGDMSQHRRLVWSVLAASSAATAAPVTYGIDPNHTHPLVELDHFAGLSTWRGLFRTTSGTITLDREHATGTVEGVVGTASIDFRHDKLNQIEVHTKSGNRNCRRLQNFPHTPSQRPP